MNEIETSEDETENMTYENAPGAVDADLSLTVNLGNFSSFKFSLGINEVYSGEPGDTREDKVNELAEYLKNKVTEKIIELTAHNKVLISELKNVE